MKYAPNHKLQVKGKDFFDISFFRSPETRPLFFQFIAELKDACEGAQPTRTHMTLKRIAEEGRLVRWYTQNIDCLEERIGLSCYTGEVQDENKASYTGEVQDENKTTFNVSSTAAAAATKPTAKGNPALVVTLHGTLNQVSCTQCRRVGPLTAGLLESFRAGRVESCQVCHDLVAAREAAGKRRIHRVGLLRPDIVLYNEPHPHGDVIAEFISEDMNKLPGLLIVMGTSLKIAGLKKMIKDFAKAMKKQGNLSGVSSNNNNSRSNSNNVSTEPLVIFVNKTPAPKGEWQGVFDYELIGGCDEILAALESIAASSSLSARKSTKSAKPKSSSIGVPKVDTSSLPVTCGALLATTCGGAEQQQQQAAGTTHVQQPIVIGNVEGSGKELLQQKDKEKKMKMKMKRESDNVHKSNDRTTFTHRKPIIKKANRTVTVSESTTATTTATASVPVPDSPLLSHSKSKLPVSVATSPINRHRISDFFSPIKGLSSSPLGKKLKKPLTAAAAAGSSQDAEEAETALLPGCDKEGHAVMGNLEI